MPEIANIEELLSDYLGPDRELVGHKVTNLTAPGENYGSVMLKLELQVRNKITKKEETIQTVAKTPPPAKKLWEVFNIPVTFKNEIGFYSTIFPEFRKIQQEHNVKPCSYHPGFVASRLNLNGAPDVDEHAVLVLDNLVVQGFQCANRYDGFDLPTTEFILRDLANFHASAIAIRKHRPEVYETKIRPFLDGFNPPEEDENQEGMLNCFRKVFAEHSEISGYIDKVVELLKKPKHFKPTEPFVSVSHNDLWVNNTMLKFQAGKAVENKFIDFQVCCTSSVVADLIFLLLSSVHNEVVTENFQKLLHFYYEQLVSNLEALKVDTKPFTLEAFNKELMAVKDEQMKHALWMYFPILMEKSKAKELKEFDEEGEPFGEMSQKHVDKLKAILPLLKKHGWLD